MSYHEIKFCSNSNSPSPNILNINIENVDRSLINRSDISIKNWSVGEPKKSGYYRVLLYDIKPNMYQLNILYYSAFKNWYMSYDSIPVNLPIALWQDLNCSSL